MKRQGSNVHKHQGLCRSCNAEIWWAHLRDKPHPVDRLPVPGGRLILTLKQSEGVVLAQMFDASVHEAARNRYESHFSTCPNAKQHRRRND